MIKKQEFVKPTNHSESKLMGYFTKQEISWLRNLSKPWVLKKKKKKWDRNYLVKIVKEANLIYYRKLSENAKFQSLISDFSNKIQFDKVSLKL